MSHHVAWAGEVIQHTDASHEVIHWAIRILPGGAATLLLIVGWALRARIRNWITNIVKDVMRKGKGGKSDASA